MTASAKSSTATTSDILALTQKALDAFDVVPLETSVRQAIRIANLLGETAAAVRLSLELHASRGHAQSNRQTIERLLAEPGLHAQPGGIVLTAIEEYIAERTADPRTDEDEVAFTHSLAEIEFWLAEPHIQEDMAGDQVLADITTHYTWTKIKARARHHAFTLLCKWERELTFSTQQETALTVVGRRVDRVLADGAPEILNQFNVAFRRLHDAAARDSESEATEEFSQAVASCRRILKAVIDVVRPADPAHKQSDDGHALTDDAYRNRLVEYLKETAPSSTFRAAVTDAGRALFERFKSTDELASKGVHAKVARDEAEFCALHSYLLAGEILLLADYGIQHD